jgi:K(+)-stimulated pyrophosphate-energized sodium pump
MHFGAPAALLFALQDYSQAATPISSSDTVWLWIALAVGVLALIAALLIARSVIAGDTGTADMRAISDAIREGAEAFLARQYRTIGIIAVVLAVIVFLGYHA